MRIQFLRSIAVTLGLSVACVAQAQYGGYPGAPGYPSQPSTMPLHPSLQQSPAPQQAPAYPQSARYQPAPMQPPVRVPGGQAGNAYQPPQQQVPTRLASNEPVPGYAPTPRQAMPGGQHNPVPAPMPVPAPTALPAPAHEAPAADCGTCNTAPIGSSFQRAVSAPWGAPPAHFAGGNCGTGACGPAAPAFGPVPLRNWFAGGNIMFLDLNESCDRRLLFDQAMPSTTVLSTGDVDPGANVAFEVFFGRYFNCGQHALMVNYFFFNPEEEFAAVDSGTGMLGRNGNVAMDHRISMPNWEHAMFDVGMDGDPMNDLSMYTLFEGNQAYRISRDVSFQGLELNLASFGLGGARRAAVGPLGPGGACGSCGTACGGSCGGGAPPAPGCGGACGPMVPACNSRLQVQTLHGLRWFQFRDAFQFAASTTDHVYGATADDLYYNIDTENNLLGYQFGGRLDYCLGHRLNVYAGAKMGIYANRAEFRSRLGSVGDPAYVGAQYPSTAGQSIVVENSDTVLSTLGELDLGLGYRINNCWTINGGYRLYGITGVATTVGSIADDVANLQAANQVCADESIILHGGYVGASYNW